MDEEPNIHKKMSNRKIREDVLRAQFGFDSILWQIAPHLVLCLQKKWSPQL